MNKSTKDMAAAVFEKVGGMYRAEKSRFGDVIIGGRYTKAFVERYANDHANVVIDTHIRSTDLYAKFDGADMTKAAQRLRKPTRTEIVERAKADISELQIERWGRKYYHYDIYLCRAEFIVNKDKRTVAVLLRHIHQGIKSRGIAKCAPDDCFNVHIGKAIALRRALGEEVPDEYLNAPAPEGVEVGDVIERTNSLGEKYTRTVIDISENKLIYGVWSQDPIESQYGPVMVLDDSARYE